jgi:predicted glycosyltransferase
MYWFDLVTPKSVMFFRRIIEELKKIDSVFVTAREGLDYKEVVALLELYNIEHTVVGKFGGADLYGKLDASLDRQKMLMELIKDKPIEKMVSLCSVDATRVAFGLGMPVYNFYDIPLSDYRADFRKALPQARLTIPLATKMFHPYLVPKDIIRRFSLDDSQIYTYQFYDTYMWLKDFKPDREFFRKTLQSFGLDESKKTIIIREEEYKSSYVDKKYPFLYEALPKLKQEFDVNVLIIPRYEAEYLKEEFPFAAVLEEKTFIQHLLAFADLFIGGGGTINWEACHFGTPVISTRSFITHYDMELINQKLMYKADTEREIRVLAYELIGRRHNVTDYFAQMELGLENIIKEIIE